MSSLTEHDLSNQESFKRYKQLDRLSKMGRIFFQAYSEAEPTQGISVFEISVPINPDDDSSIEISNQYFVKKNPENQEICIILKQDKVDLGYEIPVIDATDTDAYVERQELAEKIVGWIHGLNDLSEEEKALIRGQEALRTTLLSSEEKILLLNDSDLINGKCKFTQADLLTGWSMLFEIDINDPELDWQILNFISMVEFNLLNQLVQIYRRDKNAIELRQNIFDLFRNKMGQNFTISDF